MEAEPRPPDPMAAAEALWRALLEHQPAVAAALAVQLRDMPEDWPLRAFGVGRPHAALELPAGADMPMEVVPYDAADWENCPACGEDGHCRFHAGFVAGYEILNQPLREASRLDPAVTVVAVLNRLADAEEAAESGELAAAVERFTRGGGLTVAIRTQTLHIALCDVCGTEFDADGENWCWDDTPALALDQVAGNPDWTRLPDDRVVCPRSGREHDKARGGDSPVQLRPGRDAASTTFGPVFEPGTLLVAVGPAGAGKSYFAESAAIDVVVCLDSLRREIGGDAGDQSVTPAAVARQNELLEQYLRVGATVLVDATNVEPRVRAGLVDLARRHRRPIVALRIVPGLETCLSRNAARPANRRVPDDTLRWQHALACEATEPALLAEGFTAVHQVHPTPTGVTVSNDVISPERIADAVAVLRKAQQGDQEAHRDLGTYFPEYEGLVMQTDHTRYLELAAAAGMVATHLLLLQTGGEWLASVDTYTSDFSLPLASVALGDYADRTEAVRETVRAATEHGWTLAPEHEWADFDCGGGEIHIPIHARPTH